MNDRLREVFQWCDDMGIAFRYNGRIHFDHNQHQYVEFRRMKRNHAVIFKLTWGGR
jgi:hypothetical protein